MPLILLLMLARYAMLLLLLRAIYDAAIYYCYHILCVFVTPLFAVDGFAAVTMMMLPS